MTTPLEVEPGATTADPEAVLKGMGKIEGRSLGQIAWMRFKRDKVAVAGGIVVICLVLLAVFSKLIEKVFDLAPNAFPQDLVDPNTVAPKGGMGGMSWAHPLGVDPQFGRDLSPPGRTDRTDGPGPHPARPRHNRGRRSDTTFRIA